VTWVRDFTCANMLQRSLAIFNFHQAWQWI
jgi:hypothetical protein